MNKIYNTKLLISLLRIDHKRVQILGLRFGGGCCYILSIKFCFTNNYYKIVLFSHRKSKKKKKKKKFRTIQIIVD